MSATKTTLIAVIVVVLAFAAGLAVGVVGDRLLLSHRGGPPAGGPPFATERMARHLDRELDLTDAQQTQVEQILEHHRSRMIAMFEQSRSPIRTEIDATNAEIARVLTPEQRAKFERLKMRMGPHRPMRHGRRGMGWGGPS